MINSSADYQTALAGSARTFSARLLYNGNTVEGIIRSLNIHKGSCGSSKFDLGSVYAPYIECTIDECPENLENKELVLQIGVMTNNDYDNPVFDYIDIGYFTVYNPSVSSRRCTFTAYGRLSAKCNIEYTSALTYPASITDILAELSTQVNIPISTRYGDFTGSVETDLSGWNVNEVLNIIAGLIGGYATEDNAGGIVVSAYSINGAGYVTDNSMCTSEPAFYSNPYVLDGIKCNLSVGEGSIGNAFVYGNEKYEYQNEYMTQTLWDKMIAQIGGLTFNAGEIVMAKGDPRLEPWDIISFTGADGTNTKTPCMELLFQFDGGIITTISAPGESEAETASGFMGPMAQRVQKAQETAESKTSIIYSATQPVGNNFVENDVWFDTAHGAAMYYWDGECWQLMQFGTDSIADKAITVDKLTVSDLAALRATIGSWTIGTYKIYAGDGSEGSPVAAMQAPIGNLSTFLAAGGTSHTNYGDCPFLVDKHGKLRARNVTIGETDKQTLTYDPSDGYVIIDGKHGKMLMSPDDLGLFMRNSAAGYTLMSSDHGYGDKGLYTNFNMSPKRCVMQGSDSAFQLELFGDLELDSGKHIYSVDPSSFFTKIRNHLIGHNGVNMWIGAPQTAARHHSGRLILSTGYDNESGRGYKSVVVCVPNDNNDGGESYEIWHTGNRKALINYSASVGSANITAVGANKVVVTGSVTVPYASEYMAWIDAPLFTSKYTTTIRLNVGSITCVSVVTNATAFHGTLSAKKAVTLSAGTYTYQLVMVPQDSSVTATLAAYNQLSFGLAPL